MKLDCSFYNEINEIVDGISELTLNESRIDLLLEGRSFSASFDLGSILTVPQVFLRASKSGHYHQVDKESTLGIISHEYGHVVLSDYLEDRFEVLRPFFKLKNTFSSLQLKAYEIRTQLVDKNTSAKARVELQKDLLDIANELKRVRVELAKDKKNEMYYRLMLPYQELFADVLSVYHYEDKEFISKVVDHPHYNSDERTLVRARSFNKVDVDYKGEALKSEHARFYLVRQFIGDHMWPKSVSHKKEYVERILDAISYSLSVEFENLSDESSYIEQSNRLINYLKK